MLKRFSITLIVLSTLVYGSVFIMSKYHGTGFFEEVLMQMNRLETGFGNKIEVRQSKALLSSILESEAPPENWDRLIVPDKKTKHQELFYHYKVWTIKIGLTQAEVRKSYPIYKSRQQNMTIINMRYGRQKTIVQFPFFRDSSNQIVTGLFFPVNELPFSADLNKDGAIDHRDVTIAKKKFSTG